MKVRSGFVSNSSSSSFVCDFCGVVESGYDCSLSDFDMQKCEHDHVFCIDHMTKDFNPTNEEIYKKVKLYFEDTLKNTQETLEKFEARYTNPDSKLDSWEESCIGRDPNYITNSISRYKQSINETKSKLDELEKQKDTLSDYYIDLYNDLTLDEGIPEEYCPVCQRKKEMEKDPEYSKYKELYEKFNGVNPNGCKR